MKSLLPWIPVFLLCGSGVGQEMEPSLDRAAGNLAARLAQVLPAIEPAPTALALVADDETDPAVVGALAKVLTHDGYRVVFGRRALEGAEQVLVLLVSADTAPSPGRVSIELEGLDHDRLICLFGDADWLDEIPRGAIQVEGPFRAERDTAVEAAFDLAWQRYKARLPERLAADFGPAALHKSPHRLIVTFSSANDGRRVYRAHLQLMPDERIERALKREARRASEHRAWQPWKRIGLLAVLALVLGFAYIRTDLRTRGYMTGTLRVLFGILFIIGVFACWRITL